MSAGAVSPLASRRKPSVTACASAPRRPMWSTMGQAAKQAPQAVHRAASSGPAWARKASVVSARAGCSLVMARRVCRFGRLVKAPRAAAGSDRPPEVPYARALNAAGSARATARARETRMADDKGAEDGGRLLYQVRNLQGRPQAPPGNYSNTIGAEQGIEVFGGERDRRGARGPRGPISSRPARSPSSPRPTCWSSAAARPERPRPSPPPASAPTCCSSSATTTWAAFPPAASSSGSTA